MYKFSLQDLQERLKKVEESIENESNGFENNTNELQRDVQTEIDALLSYLQNGYSDTSIKLYDTLYELQAMEDRIKDLKGKNDFYDEDAELDIMFPNRHDDDFDEDSMSYDSVFGKD
jgi:hypothetical protein